MTTLQDAVVGLSETARRLEVKQQITTMSGGKAAAVQVFLGFIERPQGDRDIEPSDLLMVDVVFARTQKYYGLLREFIKPGSIAVLTGGTGAGKSLTAFALLADASRADGERCRSLSFGAESTFDVDRLRGAGRCNTVLELPSDEKESEVSAGFGRQLHEISAILAETGGRLVVVAGEDQWSRIRTESPVRAHSVVPAPSVEIVQRWLEYRQVKDAQLWVEDPDIEDLLEKEKPQGAMEIVRLIENAAQAPVDKLPKDLSIVSDAPDQRRETIFKRRVLSVLAALKSWRKELLKWHSKSGRTSLERNFMLIAATYGELPVGDIYESAQLLAQHFNETSATSVAMGQEGIGVIQMVEAIEAELSEDVVTFPRPGWPDAVIEYFWVDRPRCRDSFLDWLIQSVVVVPGEKRSKTIYESQVDRARRVAEFVLRSASRLGKIELLETVVESWHSSELLRQISVNMVDDACFDQVLGTRVHEKLRLWALGSDPVLQETAARVCAAEFGVSNPGKALVRLRHAAKSGSPAVIEAVRAAVKRLWLEPAVQPALLKQTEAWCAANDPAGPDVFSALAEIQDSSSQKPALLLAAQHAGSAVSTNLIYICWQSFLVSDLPDSIKDKSIWGWFAVAERSVRDREIIFKIFRRVVVEASDRHAARGNLDESLYRWCAAQPESHGRRRIWTELNEQMFDDHRHVPAGNLADVASGVDVESEVPEIDRSFFDERGSMSAVVEPATTVPSQEQRGSVEDDAGSMQDDEASQGVVQLHEAGLRPAFPDLTTETDRPRTDVTEDTELSGRQ